MESLRFDIELQLEGIKEMLEAGLELTKQPGGPAPRAENFLDDLQIVDRMLVASKESWNTLYEEMQNWTFSRAKTCKGDEYDKVLNGSSAKITG